MRKIWKVALAQADMSLADLAKKMDRSNPYISRVINRRVSPKLDEAFKMLRILGRQEEELQDFFGDGSVIDW